MADSYTLSIERKPLTRGFCAGLCAAFAAMLLLTAAWKGSQQARHLVWKSESNYFSNRGRLDAVLHAKPKKMIFLGSSRTGRIPGEENRAGLPWDCLGLDASNAAEGVQLMLKGILPVYPVVVVEMESYFTECTVAFPQGSKATPSFFFFARTPYRFSSLLYSELRQQYAAAAADSGAWHIVPPSSEQPAGKPDFWTPGDEAKLHLLQRLQTEYNCRIQPMILPERNGRADAVRRSKAHYAATQLRVPLLDLNEHLVHPRPLRFTDHIHMAPEDAFQTASAVYSYIFPAN